MSQEVYNLNPIRIIEQIKQMANTPHDTQFLQFVEMQNIKHKMIDGRGRRITLKDQPRDL